MIEWVGSNKEWLFSGAGVAILLVTGRWLMRRRGRGVAGLRQTAVVSSADLPSLATVSENSEAVSKSDAPPNEVEPSLRHAVYRFSLNLGDYRVTDTGRFKIRVRFLDIERRPSRRRFTKDHLHGRLAISDGLMTRRDQDAGEFVQHDERTYWLPELGWADSGDAVFKFDESDDCLRFYCVSLGHINEHAGTVEVRIGFAGP